MCKPKGRLRTVLQVQVRKRFNVQPETTRRHPRLPRTPPPHVVQVWSVKVHPSEVKVKTRRLAQEGEASVHEGADSDEGQVVARTVVGPVELLGGPFTCGLAFKEGVRAVSKVKRSSDQGIDEGPGVVEGLNNVELNV